MACNAAWHYKDRVIFVRCEGEIDMETLRAIDAEMITNFIGKSSIDNQLVHIVIDMTAATKMPTQVHRMKGTLTHLNHPRVGWSVLITSNRMIRYMGSILTQLAKARFRAFATVEEGLAFLAETDSTLKGLSRKAE